MRKRTNSSRNANSSRPSGDDQKSFRRARPETESRFSKPSIKKSSFRAATAPPKADKPGSYKPRAFDTDSRSYRGEDRPSRDGSDKPRFDKPRFDKPGIGRPRPSDSREIKPRTDRNDNSSEDRRNDRPRFADRDNVRSFKPKTDSNFRERGESFERPSGERRSFPKSQEGPSREFRPREESGRERSERPGFERPAGRRDRDSKDFTRPGANVSGRSERPGLKKKEEPLTHEERIAKQEIDSEEAASRRVGQFEKAPYYKLDTYEKKAGLKKRQDPTDEKRLNRYIANAGICSRREADELIASGQIQVNGKVVTEMGFKVSQADVVKFGKKVLNPEKFVYVLINKPKDYITTTDDPEERKTVLDLIKGACAERIYPVGRLDRNTTGLLLLTNDGELAKKLTHPSSGIKKIYQAELDKPITTEDFEKLQQGVELEDGFIRPDDTGIVTPDAMVVGLEIHSGHNRVVRRIFEHLGYEVQKLDRTVFAGLDKKDLPRGKWRFLTEKEVVKLKYMM